VSNKTYTHIQDKHGAIASISISPDNIHEVRYYVDERFEKGIQFYTELFVYVPIELVELSVRDWALGKRSLT
jgi:hypothetical protein